MTFDEWISDNGFSRLEDGSGFERTEVLTPALRIVTRLRHVRPDDNVVQRPDKPYVIEMACVSDAEKDVTLKRLALCDGKPFTLSNALKLCGDCFWRDAAVFGRLLLVAGALHGGEKWIDEQR